MRDLGTRPILLVLLTSELSHLLVRGQLAATVDAGFEVHVGVGSAANGSDETVRWDRDVLVHPLPFRRTPSLLADLQALWATVRLIRKTRPVIVSASTPKAGLIGMIAARICRVPVRVHVLRGLRSEGMSGLSLSLLRMMERLTVRYAHHVIVNSPSLLAVAEDASVLPMGKGIVLGDGSGNGVNLSRYAAEQIPDRISAARLVGTDPEATVVGYVGRMTTDKGIGDLIAGFDQLSGDNLQLLLVGPMESGDAIADSVRTRVNEDPRIIHLPWLDDPRVAYAAMDVLAFTSVREGMPNVVLEAQMCRVLVVGYAATGTIDAVNHPEAGLLVPVGDVGALTAALQKVIDDPSLRSKMGAAAREWVSAHFDQQKIWDELLGLYRRWLADAGVGH